ncbi:Uncharacterised protein [Shigella sonnei]|nr:Uncharacterised protein [Shigella sonnei]
MRHRRRVSLPVKSEVVIARRFQRDRWCARFLAPVLNTYGFILLAGTSDKIIALSIGKQRRHHTNGARGILHIHRRAAVVLLNFHRRVRF